MASTQLGGPRSIGTSSSPDRQTTDSTRMPELACASGAGATTKAASPIRSAREREREREREKTNRRRTHGRDLLSVAGVDREGPRTRGAPGKSVPYHSPHTRSTVSGLRGFPICNGAFRSAFICPIVRDTVRRGREIVGWSVRVPCAFRLPLASESGRDRPGRSCVGSSGDRSRPVPKARSRAGCHGRGARTLTPTVTAAACATPGLPTLRATSRVQPPTTSRPRCSPPTRRARTEARPPPVRTAKHCLDCTALAVRRTEDRRLEPALWPDFPREQRP